MPNATLCGKAVVDVLLGHRNGLAVEDVEQQQVRNGNLPESYRITRSRTQRCRELDSVETQDRKGEIGSRPISLL